MAQPDFIMEGKAVTIGEAQARFFTEALRANTEVLQNVNQSMIGIQAEQRAQLTLIGDIREKMARIEARPSHETDMANLWEELTKLRGRLESVELRNAKQDGTTGAWSWFIGNSQNIAAIIIAIIAAIFLTMKATGRL